MNRQEKLEQGFLTYMEEKYNENFTFIELVGSHMGSDVREAYVKSSRYPEERIWVERSENEENEEIYRDNYMGYYYQEEIRELILSTMKEQFIKAHVEYYPFQSIIVGNKNAPETLVELLEKGDTMLSIEITAEDILPDKEAGMELWRRNLSEKNLRLNGKVSLENSTESCFFAMDSFYEFNYVNWR